MDLAFSRIKNIVESLKIKTEFDCLKTIVLNVSEVCNLKCEMCPRYFDYPNSQQFMTVNTAEVLAYQLSCFDYQGIVSISGMGEPCFNKDLIKICKILNDFNVQVLSNGTLEYDYKELSKYAKILISVHDWDYIDSYRYKFAGIPVIFRNHDLNHPDCELKITNRGGWNNKENTNGICNYPFYKTMIDHDGCYILCADDWKRISKVKEININSMSIKDYFCNYLLQTKNQMIMKGRLCEPCNHCNTNGQMIGSNIVEWYMDSVSKRKS